MLVFDIAFLDREKHVDDYAFCSGCNVILITIDALRADHLGLYGYIKNTSPNLDDFSRQSHVFTNSISQSGSTVRSLASLHTSKFPDTDGVWSRGRFKKGQVTLSRLLKEVGYGT